MSWLPSALFGAILIFAIPAPAQEPPSDLGWDDFPEVALFELENGLEVVAMPIAGKDMVSMTMAYKVGSADAPAGKSGLARLVQALMFQVGKTDVSTSAARHAWTERDLTYTGDDCTWFMRQVPPNALGSALAREAERMTQAPLDDAAVAEERDWMLAQRHLRIDRLPPSQFNETMKAMMFLNHPARRSGLGWPQELAGITTEDARAFYRAHFQPDNAVLVVAGPVVPEEVRRLATLSFSAIPRAHVPERERPGEPQSYTPRRFSMESPYFDASVVKRSYRVPSYHSANGNTAAALEVLSEILENAQEGRFVRQAGKDRVRLYTIAIYTPLGLDFGRFDFFWSGEAGDAARWEAMLDDTIADIQRDGVTEAELANAKRFLRLGGRYNANRVEMAPIIAFRLALGESLTDIMTWPAKLMAVSREDVMNAARSALVAENSVTGMEIPVKPGNGEVVQAFPERRWIYGE